MDLEKIHHHKHKTPSRILIAVILSAMVVTFFSLLGRGAINLRGATINPDVNPDIAAIALLEAKFGEGVFVQNVERLRDHEETKTYDLHVTTAPKADNTATEEWFVIVRFDEKKEVWVLDKVEHMRADASSSAHS